MQYKVYKGVVYTITEPRNGVYKVYFMTEGFLFKVRTIISSNYTLKDVDNEVRFFIDFFQFSTII